MKQTNLYHLTLFQICTLSTHQYLNVQHAIHHQPSNKINWVGHIDPIHSLQRISAASGVFAIRSLTLEQPRRSQIAEKPFNLSFLRSNKLTTSQPKAKDQLGAHSATRDCEENLQNGLVNPGDACYWKQYEPVLLWRNATAQLRDSTNKHRLLEEQSS